MQAAAHLYYLSRKHCKCHSKPSSRQRTAQMAYPVSFSARKVPRPAICQRLLFCLRPFPPLDGLTGPWCGDGGGGGRGGRCRSGRVAVAGRMRHRHPNTELANRSEHFFEAARRREEGGRGESIFYPNGSHLGRSF